MSNETIELDFGDVKEFAPRAKGVAKGDYLMKVAKIEASTSKADNPMWVVDAVFVDGPHAGEQIREFMALTEKALFKVFGWLQAVEGKQLPKKKIKLPNNTAALTKRYHGKVFGAHVDNGDPYTDDNGNEVVPSEIKYHLYAKDVGNRGAPAPKEQVTASTPEPEADADGGDENPPPPTETTNDTPDPEEPSGDVASQLESFDLDSL